MKTLAVDIDGTVTENGGGRVHLGAIWALRYLARLGHRVIYVTGRSSVEGYLLSVFGGTTGIAVGENGGCITTGPQSHTLLGDMGACERAYDAMRSSLDGVVKKPVFPRMTEIVLERTFDLGAAREILSENGLDAVLSDSLYAFHINSPNVDKGSGLEYVMKEHSIPRDDVIAIGDSETDVPMFKAAGTGIALGNSSEYVRSRADVAVGQKAGDGVIEALESLFPGCAR